MPSTWVTPRVWTAGERVSASKMNELSTDFNSLFPYTTGGDIAYRDGAGAYLTRVAIGTAGQILLSTGSAPSWVSGERYFPVYLNSDVALTVGDYQGWFMVPPAINGWNITHVSAMRKAGGTGVPAFQLRNVTDSVDVLTTKVTIDTSEVTSGTAAVAPVINTAVDDVATYDIFVVDVDVAGTGTLDCVFYVGLTKP
jgi:hypothetical protein